MAAASTKIKEPTNQFGFVLRVSLWPLHYVTYLGTDGGSFHTNCSCSSFLTMVYCHNIIPEIIHHHKFSNTIFRKADLFPSSGYGQS
jgi:hypothetical protein